MSKEYTEAELEEIVERAEAGYREYLKTKETAEMKAVKKKAIDTCPWKDVPAVERTLERWRQQMDEIDKRNRNKSENGMAVKFSESRVGMSDEYKRQVIDGISQAMADQMKKNAETLDRGDPLCLMVKLDRFRSNLAWGDEWMMKVSKVDADAWKLVSEKKSNYTDVLYRLRKLDPEDLAAVIEQLGTTLTKDMMTEIAKVWNIDCANNKRKGKMMKLFEVFIVRKDNKDVSRFLAWGKDPQAIREKALLDAGITSEDYEASQVVVKFVAEFDFPTEGDAE